MKMYLLFIFFACNFFSYSQSDVDKMLKGGEIIINGLSFLKKDKSEAKETNSKIIESVCIRNKHTDKITFIITANSSYKKLLGMGFIRIGNC
jgi:hypothetical protein